MKDLLEHIDPDEVYQQWVLVLMHICRATNGSDAGLELADAWSRLGSKYTPGDVYRRWPGFRRDLSGGIEITKRRVNNRGRERRIEIKKVPSKPSKPSGGEEDKDEAGPSSPSKPSRPSGPKGRESGFWPSRPSVLHDFPTKLDLTRLHDT